MRRRKRKKQRKLIIISLISLLFIMTIGYAAFNTNLNINIKANLKEIAATTLKKKIVTSGDGLYEDSLIPQRYIYKGTNPDNYIKFNQETWRIISIEPDNTIKIIKQDDIGEIQFNNINDNQWEKSTLNTYLNNDYYNTITEKNKIVSKTFNTGPIENSNTEKTFTEIQNLEKQKEWTGNIALLNLSDYVKASTNQNCKTFLNARALTELNPPCSKNNYLHIVETNGTWLLNGHTKDTFAYIYIIWNQQEPISKSISYTKVSDNVRSVVNPVLYLKKNISIKRSGTKESPYIIN